MDLTRYRTVARSARAVTEVRRSRFLCRVERVGTEDAARAVVDAARREHADAGHHCSAFLLGPDASVERSSDDGEPSGTAGAPILEVLRGREVSDVVVVVTRWFGGTLLGTGGLVRAYADAARAGLDAAGVRERRLADLVDVAVEHGVAGRLENDLRSRGVRVLGVDHAAHATLHLAAPPDLDLAALLAELTGGSAHGVPVGRAWSDG